MFSWKGRSGRGPSQRSQFSPGGGVLGLALAATLYLTAVSDLPESVVKTGVSELLSAEIIAATGRDPQEIGAVSVDFLQYSAYVLLVGLWLQAAGRAQDALEQAAGEEAFYQAKLSSAAFYLRRVLPRASAHREAIQGGAECLMALPESDFAF